MNRGISSASLLFLTCLIPACSQTADLPAAVGLLRQVAQRYAEAQNYYIRAVEKDTYSGEFDGGWTKRILIAAEAGRRFHFEVKTGAGRAIAIADGKTVWLRHAGERVSASTPESDQSFNNTIRTLNQDVQIKQARRLKTTLVKLARDVTEASFLPDQSFERGDGLVRSRVILIRESKGLDAPSEKTVWIDEDEEKILKIVERKTAPADSAGGAKDIEITTTFNTSFDASPPDCLLGAEVPDEASYGAASPSPLIMNPLSLVGKKLPDLRFKSSDGTTIPLSSLAGKPLLIDFWATWCSPCVASLPELAEIYEETRGKGLTFLAVDQDNEPGKASLFLQKKGYTWTDYTDPDGEVHKQLGYEGLPHVILVDSTGTIIYDGTGENVKELRFRIAQLIPGFRSFAPESQPCTIAN